MTTRARHDAVTRKARRLTHSRPHSGFFAASFSAFAAAYAAALSAAISASVFFGGTSMDISIKLWLVKTHTAARTGHAQTRVHESDGEPRGEKEKGSAACVRAGICLRQR